MDALDKTDGGCKVLLVTETAVGTHTCGAGIWEAEAGVPGQPGIYIEKAGL